MAQMRTQSSAEVTPSHGAFEGPLGIPSLSTWALTLSRCVGADPTWGLGTSSPRGHAPRGLPSERCLLAGSSRRTSAPKSWRYWRLHEILPKLPRASCPGSATAGSSGAAPSRGDAPRALVWGCIPCGKALQRQRRPPGTSMCFCSRFCCFKPKFTAHAGGAEAAWVGLRPSGVGEWDREHPSLAPTGTAAHAGVKKGKKLYCTT